MDANFCKNNSGNLELEYRARKIPELCRTAKKKL
jgi:hypothetical protein